MGDVAFISFQPPLWLLMVLLLMLFAPAGIGGAVLGAAVWHTTRGTRVAGASIGGLVASLVAFVGARLLFGGAQGTVDSDDQLWVSVALGVLLGLATLVLFVVRRLRPSGAADTTSGPR